jgi:pimeloyl-ACP methyl ester carboxylesterase
VADDASRSSGRTGDRCSSRVEHGLARCCPLLGPHPRARDAAAPDFTEDLLWARLDDGQRAALRRDGVIRLPSSYGEPLAFTWRLVEDGRRHLVLRSPLALSCPVRLLHGTRDLDVPWETSCRLAEALRGRDVTLTLVKDGEHRLSEPHELSLLGAAVASLL